LEGRERESGVVPKVEARRVAERISLVVLVLAKMGAKSLEMLDIDSSFEIDAKSFPS